MRTQTVVRCDVPGCDASFEHIGPSRESLTGTLLLTDQRAARKRAAAEGWTNIVREDFCPPHGTTEER